MKSFAVGEDAVDVEEEEFDLAGAGWRGRVWASAGFYQPLP